MEHFLPRLRPILDQQYSDTTLHAILERLSQRADVVLFEREGFKERDYWILKGQLDLVRYSLLAPTTSVFYTSTADGYREGVYLIRHFLDDMSVAVDDKWNFINGQD